MSVIESRLPGIRRRWTISGTGKASQLHSLLVEAGVDSYPFPFIQDGVAGGIKNVEVHVRKSKYAGCRGDNHGGGHRPSHAGGRRRKGYFSRLTYFLLQQFRG